MHYTPPPNSRQAESVTVSDASAPSLGHICGQAVFLVAAETIRADDGVFMRAAPDDFVRIAGFDGNDVCVLMNRPVNERLHLVAGQVFQGLTVLMDAVAVSKPSAFAVTVMLPV